MRHFLKYGNFLLQGIQLYYPLDSDLLSQYSQYLDWKLVSQNQSIQWDFERLKQYSEQLDWSIFSFSSRIWTKEEITYFLPRIYLDYFSQNALFESQFEIVSLFCNQPNSILWSHFSDRVDFSWSIEFIQMFQNEWNWNRLSSNQALPWSYELIDAFKDFWNWSYLSQNPALPWNRDLLDWVISKMNVYLPNDNPWLSLCLNSGLPWDDELLQRALKQEPQVSILSNLSANPSLPWSISLIEKYKDKWDWAYMNLNTGIPWSIELISHFQEYFESADIYHYTLANNPAIPWSIELIDHFSHLNFGDDGLSTNPALPWSLELIERYKHRWKWWALARNDGIPWNYEWVKPFDIYFRPGSESGNDNFYPILLQNPSVQWTWEFLDAFDNWVGPNFWKYEKPSASLWEELFKPVIDSQTIAFVLKELLA